VLHVGAEDLHPDGPPVEDAAQGERHLPLVDQPSDEDASERLPYDLAEKGSVRGRLGDERALLHGGAGGAPLLLEVAPLRRGRARGRERLAGTLSVHGFQVAGLVEPAVREEDLAERPVVTALASRERLLDVFSRRDTELEHDRSERSIAVHPGPVGSPPFRERTGRGLSSPGLVPTVRPTHRSP
jgi:hypothetical protein